MEHTWRYRLASMSVAIVDDHEIVLEGFRSFIVKSGCSDVLAFKTAQALLRALASRKFDVCIVDVELADMEVSALIDAIRDVQPDTKIVINTIHEEPWVVNIMTEKKVDGVIYKSSQLDQLLEALVTVKEGRQYFCSKFKRTQQRLLLQPEKPTQRELEVLTDIAKGHSTKEIANHLYISENTAENHRKRLFQKLKAHNMADLIVKAIAAGYINPEEIVKKMKN